MKRAALLLACLLIASTAIAAEKTTTKKSEGVSAVKKSKKISKPWEPTAFVEDGERLPANYSGLDPEKFLHMLQSKVESLNKGEFETSEQYERRTANKEALLAPINTSNLYAFRVETLVFSEYDADTQTYRPTHYKCNPIKKEPTEIVDWVACSMATTDLKGGRYNGSNAYGATAAVDSTTGRYFAIGVPFGSHVLSSLFDDGYLYRDELSVPLEKAKKLKGMEIAVLFVGRVTDAKIINGPYDSRRARLDDPREWFFYQDVIPFDLKKIVYYVVKSGEILGEKSF